MIRLRSRAALLPAFILLLFIGSPRVAAQDVERDATVIFVDASDPSAADENAGTETNPFRTIGRAISAASEANARGTPARIVVQEGTYRESVNLTPDQRTTTASVSIEGRGDVVITGSDVWTGWTTVSEGIYSHQWLNDWGLGTIPAEWPDTIVSYLEANPEIRRREMVFVDQVPLRQVMSRDEVMQVDGAFYVSEETDELLIHPATEDDFADVAVEVAVRPTLLVVGSRQNITIQNITFQHAANPVGSTSAAIVANSRAVSLLDSRFIQNNGTGLGVSQSEDVTIQGVEANDNGVGGITGFQVADLAVVETEASFNGWRASSGWDVSIGGSVLDPNFIDFGAGQKFFGLRDATFRNFRALDNLTGGLWLDYDNSGVVLDGVVLRRNLTHGLFLEASQGPISVQRSQICDNETGILVGNAADVVVVDSVLANNDLGQVFLAGDAERSVITHDTGEALSVRTHDWVMRGNYFAVRADGVAVATHVDQSVWSSFVRTLASDHNRYHSLGGTEIFQLPGGRKVSLNQWRHETGRDLGSVFVVDEGGCPMPTGTTTPSEERPVWFVFIALLGVYVVGIALVVVAYRRRRQRRTSV